MSKWMTWETSILAQLQTDTLTAHKWQTYWNWSSEVPEIDDYNRIIHKTMTQEQSHMIGSQWRGRAGVGSEEGGLERVRNVWNVKLSLAQKTS